MAKCSTAGSLELEGYHYGKTMRSGQFVSDSKEERVLYAKELIANDISIREAARFVKLSPSALFRSVGKKPSDNGLGIELCCKLVAILAIYMWVCAHACLS